MLPVLSRDFSADDDQRFLAAADRFSRTSFAWVWMGDFGPEGVCRFVSRHLLGHGFGAIPAPCGSSLFCFGCAALWVTVSGQIFLAKCGEKISPEPP
jgi:hypothetical protein